MSDVFISLYLVLYSHVTFITLTYSLVSLEVISSGAALVYGSVSTDLEKTGANRLAWSYRTRTISKEIDTWRQKFELFDLVFKRLKSYF